MFGNMPLGIGIGKHSFCIFLLLVMFDNFFVIISFNTVRIGPANAPRIVSLKTCAYNPSTTPINSFINSSMPGDKKVTVGGAFGSSKDCMSKRVILNAAKDCNKQVGDNICPNDNFLNA